MMKKVNEIRNTDKKKPETTQILQRSEIQFEVGKKKTFLFGETESKKDENCLKRFPDNETERRVESYQNKSQDAITATKDKTGKETEIEMLRGEKENEIMKDPRRRLIGAGGNWKSK